MFPITPILPSSKVKYDVSAGVLAITLAGIADVSSGKGGKGSGQSVSLFMWLPVSQYFRDVKPLVPI